MHQGAGGTEGGVIAINAEAFEVEHAEGFHHRLGAGDFVEVIVGDFGDRAAVAQIGEELIEFGRVRTVAPIGGGIFRHDDFARIDPFKRRK